MTTLEEAAYAYLVSLLGKPEARDAEDGENVSGVPLIRRSTRFPCGKKS